MRKTNLNLFRESYTKRRKKKANLFLLLTIDLKQLGPA
jgi:hypothetical protein